MFRDVVVAEAAGVTRRITLGPSSQPMTARRDLNSQDEKKHYAATPLDDFRMFSEGGRGG